MSTTPDVLQLRHPRPSNHHNSLTPAYLLTGVSNGGRGYVVQSATSDQVAAALPSTGDAIDGVSVDGDFTYGGGNTVGGIPAIPGLPVQVQAENGGDFDDGDLLEVDGDGRFRTVTTGTPVARALEDGGFAGFAWAVFL